MRITTHRPIRHHPGVAAEVVLPGIAPSLSPRSAGGIARRSAGWKRVFPFGTLEACLGLGCVAAFALAASLPADPAAAGIDPDFVRLMRFMAVLKGAFLAVALVASAWRLSRPAAAWRTAIYVGAPAAMAFGTVALWRLVATGPAAGALHLGMLALLAAALTDADFIPTRPQRG